MALVRSIEVDWIDVDLDHETFWYTKSISIGSINQSIIYHITQTVAVAAAATATAML